MADVDRFILYLQVRRYLAMRLRTDGSIAQVLHFVTSGRQNYLLYDASPSTFLCARQRGEERRQKWRPGVRCLVHS